MNKANIALLMTMYQDKLPRNELLTLPNELQHICDDDVMALSAIPLKIPWIGLVLGIFFGIYGVDRYYKGDILYGILKLILCFLGIGFIWWIIDLFLVYKGIKKDNFAKIMRVIVAIRN